MRQNQIRVTDQVAVHTNMTLTTDTDARSTWHNHNYNHNHNNNHLEEDALIITPAANTLKRLEVRRTSSSSASSYLIIHLVVIVNSISKVCNCCRHQSKHLVLASYGWEGATIENI